VTGARLIREHVPPETSVMCTWVAKSFWLYADRPLLEADATAGRQLRGEALRQRLRQADYVLFSPYREGDTDELAKHLAGPDFALAASDGRQQLLRVHRPPP
jgi:hypothetical protein